MANYTPRYVVFNDKDELVDSKKTLDAARELAKGTNYKIYDMNTRTYVPTSEEFDKFALKQEIITISDELDKMAGHLNEPACVDDETGILRARVYTAMSKLQDELKRIIYHIY